MDLYLKIKVLCLTIQMEAELSLEKVELDLQESLWEFTLKNMIRKLLICKQVKP